MTRAEQLEWEGRWARPAALCAFVAALLMLGRFVYLVVSVEATTGTPVETVRTIAANSTDLFVGSLIQAAGTLLLAPFLVFLHVSAKGRRRDLPRIGFVLSVLGPILAAAAPVLLQLDAGAAASDLVSEGAISTAEAEAALRDVGPVTAGLSIGGTFGLAFAFVVVALDAMRTGLISRFLGYIGIAIGVLEVIALPFFEQGPPIIQIFWLVAVGLIIVDRWPGGRGSAWESGEARPWPTAAEQRGAAERRRAERTSGAASDEGSEDGRGDAGTSPKRKRKERR